MGVAHAHSIDIRAWQILVVVVVAQVSRSPTAMKDISMSWAWWYSGDVVWVHHVSGVPAEGGGRC